MIKSLSLRKRILGLFFLNITVISLVIIIFALNHFTKKARYEIQDQTRALSIAMLPILNNNLVIGDLATIQQTFEDLIKDARIYRLALLDASNRRPIIDIIDLTDNNPKYYTPEWFKSLLPIQIPPSEHRIQVGGTDYGILLVEISPEILINDIWNSLLDLLYLGGIALVLSLALLSIILSHGLAPLLKLAQSAERFGMGEFSHRAQEVNVPEIAVTAHAFNQMADNISSLLEEIKQNEETKRQLAAIVEQSEEVMLTIDLQGNITNWNLGAEKLYGYPQKDILGKPITFFLPPDHSPQELTQFFIHHSEDLHTRRYEVQMLNSYGKILDIAMTASPLLNSKGEHVGEICVGRDVTERKKFVKDILQAKEMAEHAMQAKANFLAMMSHEIRTPMNAILGMTRLTLGTSLNEEQQDYLECVQSSADSLLIILNDILDLSKIEAGKLKLEITPIHLKGLIHDVTRLFSSAAIAKNIQLTNYLSPDVPSYILGDPVRLRQILSNLLNNALKFTSKGYVDIKVSLCQVSKKKYIGLQFSISDTGIGIPEDKLELIFAPFSQADSSTTRHFGGTGLGLTISSRLIELMNGKIWVESQLGKGSTFHFTVVLEALDQESLISLENQEKNTKENEKKYQIQPNINKDKIYYILLVEDNVLNQKVATILLKKMGYEVEIANDGLEAINLLKSKDYDIVFMDMQMPNLDGLEATQRIRATGSDVKNPHVPIIAMTANALQGDRERCLAVGMNDYISKPIHIDDLQRVLKKILAF